MFQNGIFGISFLYEKIDLFFYEYINGSYSKALKIGFFIELKCSGYADLAFVAVYICSTLFIRYIGV